MHCLCTTAIVANRMRCVLRSGYLTLMKMHLQRRRDKLKPVFETMQTITGERRYQVVKKYNVLFLHSLSRSRYEMLKGLVQVGAGETRAVTREAFAAAFGLAIGRPGAREPRPSTNPVCDPENLQVGRRLLRSARPRVRGMCASALLAIVKSMRGNGEWPVGQQPHRNKHAQSRRTTFWTFTIKGAATSRIDMESS